ncbi:hypothetical protein HY991_03275 [Candidatus Micrarchaeota archaeon]|nr:hypothetical protein [Candidatus Micrarchaeota archaeon]
MLISPNELNAVKEESIALMELAWEISKSRKEFESLNELQESIENSAEFKKKLQEHTKRFFWINYGYRGPAYSDEEFINAIFEAFKNQMNLGEELKKLKNAPVELEKMQAAYLAELQLKESDLLLVESAKDFLFMKMYRIDVRHKTNFTLDVIFEALSEKIGLSKEDLRNSMMDEIRSYIEGISSAKKKELEQRREYFVALLDKGRLSFFYGKDAREFVAMHIIEKQQKEAESVSEIRGQSACPGKASGPVKIVLRVEDIHKVERGDVLVAIMTIPDFVPAMAKAVAFVTDTGGITCHAAIVAREMSKPCIVGARNATKVLKEGEIIEVDATHGIVRKIGARAQQVV